MTASRQGRLDVQLLHHFSVRVEGKAVPRETWIRRKAQELVQLLSLSRNKERRREELIETLWPEAEMDDASNHLDKAIHAARRALEPGLASGRASRFVVVSDGRVHLQAPGGLFIDADEFDAAAARALATEDLALLTQAIELYGGDVLPEQGDVPWVTVRREQLRARHREVIIRKALLELRAGDAASATSTLSEATLHDPASEDLHRLLMWIYSALGRKERALRQYEECRDVLRREVSVHPSAATMRLRQLIATDTAAGLGLLTNTALGDVPLILTTLRHVERSDAELREVTAELVIPQFVLLPIEIEPAVPAYVAEVVSRRLRTILGAIRGVCVISMSRAPSPAELQSSIQSSAIVVSCRIAKDGSDLRAEARISDRSSFRIGDAAARQHPYMMFKLADELATGILGSMREAGLGLPDPGVIHKPRHVSTPEAYRAYARGKYYFHQKTVTGEAMQRAVSSLKTAIRHDPLLTEAHLVLAEVYALMDRWQLAREAAERAYAIDPESVDVIAMVASVVQARMEWHLLEANRMLADCVALDVSHSYARYAYAFNLAALGFYEESVLEALNAQELDPMSLLLMAGTGEKMYFAGRRSEAVEVLDAVLKLDPEFAIAHYYIGLIYLNRADRRAALHHLHRASELMGEAHSAGREALALAQASFALYDDALNTLGNITAAPRSSYGSSLRSLTCAHLGRTSEARHWLEDAWRRKDWLLLLIDGEPAFDFVRHWPEFARVEEQVLAIRRGEPPAPLVSCGA